MNIFINIIIGIVLSVIDLYLISFYFYIEPIYNLRLINDYFKKLIQTISFLLLFLSNVFVKTYPITVLFTFLSIIFLLLVYKRKPENYIKSISIFILLKLFLNITTTLLFSWIFNISLSTLYFHHFISYTVLVRLIEKYIFYVCISLLHKENIISFRFFKIITIVIFIYFGTVITKDLKTLFYFPDVGRTFVFVILISIASLIFFDRYQAKHELIEREQAITTQNIIKEKEYLNKYNDSVDEIRKMRHDMHNNLHIIHGYLENEDITQANDYVCNLLGIMNKSSSLVHVGITSIDSIIDDKLKMMGHRGIQYNENITNVYLGNIDINDIAIVIGLALDNAIEAAEQVDANKYVELEMKNNKDYLILHITNSIIPGSNPSFHKTSKLINPMNHGFGVKEIKHIVKQYNGEAIYEVNHDHVKLKIILSSVKKDEFEKQTRI